VSSKRIAMSLSDALIHSQYSPTSPAYSPTSPQVSLITCARLPTSTFLFLTQRFFVLAVLPDESSVQSDKSSGALCDYIGWSAPTCSVSWSAHISYCNLYVTNCSTRQHHRPIRPRRARMPKTRSGTQSTIAKGCMCRHKLVAPIKL
jgi:hypothetical protein